MRKTKEELVAVFAEYVLKQYQAGFDYKTGNRCVKQFAAAFRELVRRFGDEGREALSVLLVDTHPAVRSMAACFLLRYKNQEAMAVLRDVARLDSITGWGASEAIKRWEEGTWQLDPVKEQVR